VPHRLCVLSRHRPGACDGTRGFTEVETVDSLLSKAVQGLVSLMVVLALTLFLSAGALSWWQAWVYLAVFSVCTLVITMYLGKCDRRLLASRVKAGPSAETQRSQQVIQGFASLFFVGLFVVPGLALRFHWPEVPQVVSLAADGFVGLGSLVVFLVFRESTYTSATIEVSRGQKVIATGPYSVVRHPMYSGALLLLASTPPALGFWVALPCVLPLVLVVVIRLLAEERFLSAHLGGYRGYCRKVRYRLVPFVW
jgi:protein-S-isoprenylcysteine O-methyltransferase Ste14